MVVLEPFVMSFVSGTGIEWPSTGLADFFIIIGWAVSSSTFFYTGSIAGYNLNTGAAERVGFF